MTSITCFRCGETKDREKDDEIYAAQEYVTIKVWGGYGSQYIGDLHEVIVVFCEKCFTEVTGQWWQRREIPASEYFGGWPQGQSSVSHE